MRKSGLRAVALPLCALAFAAGASSAEVPAALLKPEVARKMVDGLLEFQKRQDELVKWEPAFEDKFDRAEVGDGWKVVGGKISIVEGALRAEADANACCYVLSLKPFATKKLRLDYEAMVEDDARLCDLSCFVYAAEEKEPKPKVAAGYGFYFGGHNNAENWLMRGNKNLWSDKDQRDPNRPRIKNKQWHAVSFRVAGNALSAYVDGKQVVGVADSDPIEVKDGNQLWGLYTWDSRARFRNVKVYVGADEKPEEMQARRKALWKSLVGDITEEQLGDAVPALIEQLGDEDYFVRRDTQNLLKRLGPLSIEPLKKALTHKDAEVRLSAEILLKELGVKEPGAGEPKK